VDPGLKEIRSRPGIARISWMHEAMGVRLPWRTNLDTD
jgi:hypothetical protein